MVGEGATTRVGSEQDPFQRKDHSRVRNTLAVAVIQVKKNFRRRIFGDFGRHRMSDYLREAVSAARSSPRRRFSKSTSTQYADSYHARRFTSSEIILSFVRKEEKQIEWEITLLFDRPRRFAETKSYFGEKMGSALRLLLIQEQQLMPKPTP